MGDLSKNFSRHEFACKCCGDIKVDPRLLIALQDLRNLAGVPIKVLSGYRCPVHNREVNGSKYSQHLLGKAADIVVEGLTVGGMYPLALLIDDFAMGGIGQYPEQGFIHVDVRKKKARW